MAEVAGRAGARGALCFSGRIRPTALHGDVPLWSAGASACRHFWWVRAWANLPPHHPCSMPFSTDDEPVTPDLLFVDGSHPLLQG